MKRGFLYLTAALVVIIALAHCAHAETMQVKNYAALGYTQVKTQRRSATITCYNSLQTCRAKTIK